MAKTAAIFIHERNEGPGTFGTILEKQGFTLKPFITPEQDIAALDSLAPDLLVVMGGPMGVYEAEKYPFLKAEIKALERRLAADKPVLGICLGSQLMTAALGEKVFKGTQGKEIGWNPLILTPEGKNHSVRHLAGDQTNMFHWHGDTYELPQGATLLASSSLYKNQIYSYGRNALALQCHPEVSVEQAGEWANEASKEVAQSKITGDVTELQQQTVQNADTMAIQGRKFLLEWLKGTGL
jgi:GMP synthase (glutamine-hydrolysing)